MPRAVAADCSPPSHHRNIRLSSHPTAIAFLDPTLVGVAEGRQLVLWDARSTVCARWVQHCTTISRLVLCNAYMCPVLTCPSLPFPAFVALPCPCRTLLSIAPLY